MTDVSSLSDVDLMDMVLTAIVSENEEAFESAFAELKRRALVGRFEVQLRGRTFIFTAENFEELENG